MLLTRHLDANATLVALLAPLATRDGFIPTAVPGVQLLRASRDVARGPQIYEPSLMVIVQGSKLAYLGPRTLEYGAGHYLIQALPVPFECETFASADAPLLGLAIGIDRAVLGELVLAMGRDEGGPVAAQTLESMSSAVLDDTMRGCVERLLRCLHDPLECQIMGQARLRELHDKLRLLESRALALEGTYTRLPADQMVIQQIEAAGIATLQETATTVSSRFASIKMTLLAIHGAFAVKSVQQIAERQARLDQQLTHLRGQATKDVAVAAAKAPGDNRVAQAQQIAAIITQTREIHELVEAAKQDTEAKFETARQMFEKSRADLAALHIQ